MAGAGRVIAGSAGGILLAPAGPGTRPLADRAKQALFGSLEPLLPGAAVLDLCAGTGAAGIEALSRGAARAVLVERDPGAVRVIAENLRRTGLAASARVIRRDAVAAVRELAAAGEAFDIAFVDPPYAETVPARRDPRRARRGRRAPPGGRDGRRDRLLARASAGRRSGCYDPRGSVASARPRSPSTAARPAGPRSAD